MAEKSEHRGKKCHLSISRFEFYLFVKEIEKRGDRICSNFIYLCKKWKREGIKFVFHILLDEFLNLCKNSFFTSR